MNEDVKKQAYADYLSGMKYKDIAEKYNVTLSTVKSWKTRYKWARKNAKSMHTKRKKACIQNIKSVHTKIETLPTEILNETFDVDEDGLTEKQRMFCLYYAISGNALQSYLKAYGCGYTTAATEGYKSLKKPKIKRKIKELQSIMREHINIQVEDMINFLTKVAKSDIRDYIKFGRKTIELPDRVMEVNYIDLKDSENVDTSLIQEIKQGKDGVTLKLVDKRWAWEKLEKLLAWENKNTKENDDVVIVNDIPEGDCNE